MTYIEQPTIRDVTEANAEDFYICCHCKKIIHFLDMPCNVDRSCRLSKRVTGAYLTIVCECRECHQQKVQAESLSQNRQRLKLMKLYLETGLVTEKEDD